MKKGVGVIASLVMVVLFSTGCCFWFSPGRGDISSRIIRDINAGPVVRQSDTIELEGAQQVAVVVQFGGGELSIGSDGGDGGLMKGEFLYNLDALKPVIEYEVTGERGSLQIRNLDQSISLERWTKEIRNEWQIGLSKAVPLAMTVDTGASHGELALGGLQITDLEMAVGAADIKVSFDELNSQEMNEMRVRSGAARLELVNLGNANLNKLFFDGGIGTYTFDLRGEWQHSAKVEIKSGVSQIIIYVPREVGIRLCPGSLKGGDYGKLAEQDGCYVNDLYQDAEIKLDINLDVGLSELKVR